MKKKQFFLSGYRLFFSIFPQGAHPIPEIVVVVVVVVAQDSYRGLLYPKLHPKCNNIL